MLSIDHQRIIKGVTVFRDYQDTSQYYYLPQDKVKIANNGKGIQFVAYIDGEVTKGVEPNFTNNLERTGGFLTLEVELGPNEAELDAIKSALASEVGSNVKLAQAPFTNGNVKLVMFGSTGNDEIANFWVAGSAKPSLFGRQTAVFSLRLGGLEAQIMWNLLKNSTQTQTAVVYDLQFLAVTPAYHVEIEIDFKATEKYWDEQITEKFKMGVKADILTKDSESKGAQSKDSQSKLAASMNIASDSDVNTMIRDLINKGSISIKQIDYTGEDRGNPFGSDDPGGIKLIKELMSSTLFEITAIPKEDYKAFKSSDLPFKKDDFDNDEGDITGNSSKSEKDNTFRNNDTGDILKEENGTYQKQTTNEPAQQTNPTTASNPAADVKKTETKDVDITVDFSYKYGYTLKKRDISEQIKRKYVFNKAEAKTVEYHPSGALSTERTGFNPEKQVMLVRLGDGPFKEITIEIRAALNFAEYQIREAIVHISYGYQSKDKSKRLHEISVMVNVNNPRKFINFFVDDFGSMTYDYYVEFIHEPGAIIGASETKTRSRDFKNVTERDIAININDHSPLLPIEIQPGHLTFSNDGIQSVQVLVAPEKFGNGRTVIFNQHDATVKKYLIYPTSGNKQYYRKADFFLKDDRVTEEHENQTSLQLVVNRPETKVLTIAPILVNSSNLIKKAIVKVQYENAQKKILRRSILLTPDDSNDVREFAIVLENHDPRTWKAQTDFLLMNDQLIEGKEVVYDTEKPFISLAGCGLKVLKVTPLLGTDTFAVSIVAIQVHIYSSASGSTPVASVILRKTKPEEVVVLKNITPSVPLSAVINVFKNDGTEEITNMVVPPNTEELLLKIFNL